jgi:diacylglycerol kinase family enzyme
MALGIVDRLPDVSVVAARAVTIAGEGPVPIELDGELAGYLPVTVTTAAAPLLLVHQSAL